MKTNTVKLAAGGSSNIAGNIRRLKVIAADGPIFIQTPSESAPLLLGETLTLETPSTRTEIVNKHSADNTVELLLIGSDEGDISSPAASVAINNQPEVHVLGDENALGLPQVVVVAGLNVIPANANRRSIMIHAGQNNVGRLWIAGTAANEGIPLDADDTIELRVKGSLSIWATDAGDKINALETV